MQLNPSEISELIKARIQNLPQGAQSSTTGTVVSVTDGIVRVHGLSEVMQGEMLEFPGNTFGLALNLERDSVGAVILGDYKHIAEGDEVKCTGRILEVPIGRELIGRVVNALGQPIDGKGPLGTTLSAPIEKIAPGVIARQSVSQPLQTGIKSIDTIPESFYEIINMKLQPKIDQYNSVTAELEKCVNQAKYMQIKGFNNETARTIGSNAK